MKFVMTAVALLLLVGTSTPTQARQEQEKDHGRNQAQAKGQEQHKPDERPAGRQTQPAPQKQSRQSQTASHQQAKSAPSQRQTQPQSARSVQPQTRGAGQKQDTNSGKSQGHEQHAYASNGNAGSSSHGRISEAHYASSFGSRHSFHVSRNDYDHRRFQYGGYSFGFIDPWPVAWGYSDDVYVVYADGGYYMYDRVHPGLRISVNIL